MAGPCRVRSGRLLPAAALAVSVLALAPAAVEAQITPPKVSGVTVTDARRQLSVSWSQSTSADGYRVQWISPSETFDSPRGEHVTGDGATTTYTISNLTAGTVYTVRVIATRGGTDGPPSDEVQGRPWGNPGAIANPTSLTVFEGSTATYTVELSAPLPSNASVTILPDVSQGSDNPHPESVTVSGGRAFRASNWRVPQRVTVTGVDNDARDPAGRTAIIIHSPIQIRGAYNIATLPSVTVTVLDKPEPALVPGVRVSETALTVSEPDGAATYTLVLGSIPTGGVTVRPTSGDTGAARVSPTAVRFTPNNWHTGQTVTVTAVSDNADSPDGQRTTSITHKVAGYGDIVTAAPVAVTVLDGEEPTPVPALPLLWPAVLLMLLAASGARRHLRRRQL